MSRLSRGFAVLTVLAAGALGATHLAGAATAAEGAGEPAGPLERSRARGPVEVTVRLEPAAPRIGDVLVLELEARAEPGVELLLPEFGEALDRFAILGFASREDLDDEGRTRAFQRYELEAPLSGAHAIPPLLVEFVDRRPDARPAPDGADAYEIESERLEFEVASVLPTGATPELRPPPPPFEQRGPPLLPTWGWAVLAAVVLATGTPLGVRAWRMWSGRGRQRSAYEIARAELDALLAQPRPGADGIDAFYVELSGIVRRYLERRFDLRSPELTTEEFFEVARRSPDLKAELRALLHAFLSRADLVKFAGHRPVPEEVEESLEAAARVLKETRASGPDSELERLSEAAQGA